MKKSLFLLVPAAFGMLTLSACFDESSTSGSSESNKSACLLNPSETGLEISCNNESYGFLKTSAGGVYGSCGAEALRDDSGFKLVCGGDSVGVVYNGKAGRNGVNGDNGMPGERGETGEAGPKGDTGASCYAEQVAAGFDIYCGGQQVGTILNGTKGENGYSCSVKKGTTTSTATISCEDGSNATLTAIQGVAGENCTTSGLRQKETSLSSDYYGQTYNEITCDGETIKVYDGKSIQGEKGDKGDDGVGCSAVKNATTGNITITCGAGDDETSVVITKPLDGAAGKNGKSCSIADNEDGTATITCETDDPEVPATYTVKDGANGAPGEKGAAGKNGKSCSIADNEDGTATITCETDDPEAPATYMVKDGANGDPGAKGDAGYGCSSAAGVGFVVVTCQTGVDADENPVYKADTILAAGYATCGDENKNVYNTLTHTCVAGVVTAFDCGSAILGSNQFCENGVAYDTAAYWTAATTYPKATYGRCEENDGSDTGGVTIGAYYLLASQICEGLVAVDKYQGCNGVLYNATTHFCKAGTIYALCGGETYDPATDFCVGETTFDLEHFGPCGDTYYDKDTQTCEDGVPTDKE